MKTFKFKQRELVSTISLLKEGKLTCVELMQDVIVRSMKAKEQNMEYFTHQNFEDMLDSAFKADDRYKKGHNRPLEGIPMAVKDNIDQISEVPVTAGCNALLLNKVHREGSLWK